MNNRLRVRVLEQGQKVAKLFSGSLVNYEGKIISLYHSPENSISLKVQRQTFHLIPAISCQYFYFFLSPIIFTCFCTYHLQNITLLHHSQMLLKNSKFSVHNVSSFKIRFNIFLHSLHLDSYRFLYSFLFYSKKIPYQKWREFIFAKSEQLWQGIQDAIYQQYFRVESL